MKRNTVPVLILAVIVFLALGLSLFLFSRNEKNAFPKEMSANIKETADEEETPSYNLDEILIKFKTETTSDDALKLISDFLEEDRAYYLPEGVMSFYPVKKVKAISVVQSFPMTKTLDQLEEEITARFPDVSQEELEKEGISARKAYEIELDLSRWYKAQFSGETDPLVIAENMRRFLPDIEDAKPNYIFKAF